MKVKVKPRSWFDEQGFVEYEEPWVYDADIRMHCYPGGPSVDPRICGEVIEVQDHLAKGSYWDYIVLSWHRQWQSLITKEWVEKVG